MRTEAVTPATDVTLSLSKGPSTNVGASTNVTLSSSKGVPEAIVAAVLFRAILAPLAKGLGPVGEIAAGSVADALFLGERR